MIKLFLKLEREFKKWRKRAIENEHERLLILKYDMAIKARKIDKELAYLEALLEALKD